MARVPRIVRFDIDDQDGTGPSSVDVYTLVKDDDAGAVALGVGADVKVVRCFLPRAALNAMQAALRRPNTDTWPDGVLPHPVAKDP